jgi:hypothetical protein
MDKFLEIVCMSQIQDGENGEKYLKIFEPLLKRLQEIVSKDIYEELWEIFVECSSTNNSFYAVEGMKLAIEIMNGSYVPNI